MELGFGVTDIQEFHKTMTAKGVHFSTPPTKQEFGFVLAQFLDSEGKLCRVAQR